jgi:hypothetical protein
LGNSFEFDYDFNHFCVNRYVLVLFKNKLVIMRKLVVLLLSLFIVGTSLKAQVTPFKFEIGGLYGIPADKDAYTAGVGFYAHPSYYLGDQINVGLKAEIAVIGSADTEGMSVSISAIGSYLATCNYYFTVSKVRPYAGVGVGLYTLGTASVDDGSGNTADFDFGDKFGVAPKVGLDLGHFTINIAYNMIFGLEEGYADKNYLTAGIGVFFGGGVKGKGFQKE